MTREEAIAHGKEQLEIFGGEHRDFIEMAIKALEQEPCEDCVSRKDAIMTISEMDISEDMSVFEIKSHIGVEIGTLPSVTPQPKTGRWVDDKCSACGKGIEDLIDSSDWYRSEIPHFCPFCGLKLVEPQESDLGDYPDAIHDQFDNMTGSMNL